MAIVDNPSLVTTRDVKYARLYDLALKYERDPLTTDITEEGRLWLNTTSNELFILVDVTGPPPVANWGKVADLTNGGNDGQLLIGATGAASSWASLTSADDTLDITAGANTLDVVLGAPTTDTQASPTAASNVDARIGSVTYTGFTTAAAATQVFTIANNTVTATSAILVTASNPTVVNDAQCTVTRVDPGAGTFDVTITNNGAAAVDSDITIAFLVLS